MGVVIQHAERVYVTVADTDTAVSLPGEQIVGADTAALLGEQIEAGASREALEDIGYKDVPDEIEVPEASDDEIVVHYQTPEERNDEDAINATARANFLRNLIKHADKARRFEGLQTNHQRRPKNLKKVNAIQHNEKVMATESLQSACGVCALRDSCRLVGDIEKWFDVHPYKDEKGKLRPGSRRVLVTESKTDFLDALAEDPMTHCDPARRKPKDS